MELAALQEGRIISEKWKKVTSIPQVSKDTY